MTEIGFYHLTLFSLEQALPKLLEKALEKGYRTVVVTDTPARVEHLSAHLWTYTDDSWLPHGSGAGDRENATHQPIWLTSEEENPNQATAVVLCHGASVAVGGYARCLTLFDGNDSQAVQEARRLWSQWKAEGHTLVYYQQSPNGGWVAR